MIRLSYGENLSEFSESFKNKVLEEIDHNFDDISLYPDKYRDEFILAASKYYSIKPQNIITETGIKGVLNLIFQIYKQKSITIFSPSYFMYEKLSKDYDLKINKIKKLEEIGENESEIILIANPNNPTGEKLIDYSKLIELSKKRESSILIIDECYSVFPNDSFIKEDLPKNVLIIRSFSKNNGMAGIRLGYVVGHEDLIKRIKKARLVDPLNVGSISYLIGKIALEMDNKKYENFIKIKESFIENLNRIENIKIIPTRITSIILDLSLLTISPKEFVDKMYIEGIEIKSSSIFENFNKNYVLFGIPREEDQDFVLEKMKLILNKK
jgi:histidinol-phosphate aminotransferase